MAGEKQIPPLRCGVITWTAVDALRCAEQEPAQEPGQAAGTRYPDAVVVPAEDQGQAVNLESDTQMERNKVFVLDGTVVITYGDRVLRADHVEYDANTGET